MSSRCPMPAERSECSRYVCQRFVASNLQTSYHNRLSNFESTCVESQNKSADLPRLLRVAKRSQRFLHLPSFAPAAEEQPYDPRILPVSRQNGLSLQTLGSSKNRQQLRLRQHKRRASHHKPITISSRRLFQTDRHQSRLSRQTSSSYGKNTYNYKRRHIQI